MIEMSTTTSTTVVTVAGDLDVSERSLFDDVVTRVNELRRPRLVVDLCAADWVDSAGATFLVSLAERTRSRGGVSVLRGADDRCLFVLDVTDALRHFTVDEHHVCRSPLATGAGPGGSVLDGAGLELPVV
jgi:anti-anti-sigma factor